VAYIDPSMPTGISVWRLRFWWRLTLAAFAGIMTVVCAVAAVSGEWLALFGVVLLGVYCLLNTRQADRARTELRLLRDKSRD
jgi:drug/metabolite transporter (DMT)-like permease